MALPAAFAGHTQILMARERGRGVPTREPFELGPYEVSDITGDWRSPDGAASHDGMAAYSYVLRGAEARTEGRCTARSAVADPPLGEGWSLSSQLRARLACDCGPIASLRLEHDGRSLVGTLTHRSRVYDVRAITALDGRAAQHHPVGYRADGDEPLAAVEVQQPGRVWLKPDADEPGRAELTCLLVGLMLYQPAGER